MAGYSGTPLNKKLGIKSGFRIYILNPLNDYFDLISPLPDHLTVMEKLKGEVDMVHLFTDRRVDFGAEQRLGLYARCLCGARLSAYGFSFLPSPAARALMMA